MAIALIGGPWDFPDILAAFDPVTSADLTPFDSGSGADAGFLFEITLGGVPITVLYEEFTSWGEVQLTSWDPVAGLPTPDLRLSLDAPFDFDGPASLADMFEAASLDPARMNVIQSYDPAGDVTGFAGEDRILGEGVFRGLGGDDQIAITPDITAGPVVSGVRSKAYGGGGDDALIGALVDGLMVGGGGQDQLFALSGTLTLKGGGGVDNFAFANADLFSGAALPGGAALVAKIADFDPLAETLVFFRTDLADTSFLPDAVALSDLAGDVTLDQVGDFTVDGVLFSFSENGTGNAVLRRAGTDADGLVYDERIVLQGVGLAEVDAADIVLDLRFDDVFAFV